MKTVNHYHNHNRNSKCMCVPSVLHFREHHRRAALAFNQARYFPAGLHVVRIVARGQQEHRHLECKEGNNKKEGTDVSRHRKHQE